MQKLRSTLIIALALSTPLATHPWSFSGFTSWASIAFNYVKESISHVIGEKPLTAAGIGLATITFCGLAVLAKKYCFKKASTIVTQHAQKSTGTTQDANSSADKPQEPQDSQSTDQTNSNPQINIVLKQYKVLEQQGNTCGFHALKNGMLLYNMIETGTFDQKRLEQEFPIAWQKMVNKEADLTSSEIESIAHSEFDQAHYCILSDLTGFLNDPVSLTDKQFEVLCKALTRLQTIRDTTPFCFVIGNMEHKETSGKLRGSYGHWVAIVAQADPQDQVIRFHYANSLPSYSMDQTIKKLEDLVRMDPNLLKTKKVLSGCIGSIKAKLTDNKTQRIYEECLTSDLFMTLLCNEEIANDANQKNLFEALKPLKTFLRHINDHVAPQAQDEQVVPVWKDLINKNAIKLLLK